MVSKTVARTYATVLWLYDLTGGLRIGKRHRRVTKAEALAHMPTLRTDRLVAGFLYYDARADDARLTLALAAHGRARLRGGGGQLRGGHRAPHRRRRAGAGRPGAAALRAGVGRRPTVRDPGGRRGERHRACGPTTCAPSTRGTHPRSIRPAKGVHVTLPAAQLPVDIAAVIPVPGDRRSVFVLPWPEAATSTSGTTDTDYDGPLDDPACTPEDVDYLLGAVNAATSSAVTPADVTGVWAGLRPLLAPPRAAGSARERTADLSRRHTVRTSRRGWSP